MDDLLGFATFGVITLPTVLMSCWARSRRFAHLPLLVFTLSLGGLMGFRLGELYRLRSLDPSQYACGMPDGMLSIGLMWVGAWVLTVGLILLALKSTRTIGRRILLRGAPLYVLTCVLGYTVGRYVAW